MIIELYGLPGSGKSTLAARLCREEGVACSRIENRTDLVKRSVAFWIRHPFFTFRTFALLLTHSSFSHVYTKIVNGLGHRLGRYQGLRARVTVVDEGMIQNLLTLSDTKLRGDTIASYIRALPEVADLYVLVAPKADQLEAQRRMRGYTLARARSAEEEKKLLLAMEENETRVTALLEESGYPVMLVRDEADAETLCAMVT